MLRILKQKRVEGDKKYFSGLFSRLGRLPEASKDEIMKHVDHLANQAGTSRGEILEGRSFMAPAQVLRDAKKNIDAVLSKATKLMTRQKVTSIEDVISLAEQTLEGWCSREKAMAIAELVIATKPKKCVEIGVYGGRSLVPAAAALRQNGHGAIYGIETWRPEVATEHVTNEANDEWWRKIDFMAIKTNFYRFVAEQELASQIRLIEAPSADAASLFTAIDYLHIDGAHSIYNAAEDVVLYAKKVKSGGTIIMDDADWPTTGPAISILDSLGERIRTFNNDQGGIACIIYRKR